MANYADKLIRGQLPDQNDWNQYLIESHKAAPSMTPAAFAPYKTASGITSYEVLANTLTEASPSAKVLDLACGDGFLFQFLLAKLGTDGRVIGIDMSEGELEVARKNHGDNKRVSILNAKAQDLPVEDNSIDSVVSHMAFMLMLPLDPVVAEIARVLKIGGRFSAVIGNSRNKPGLFNELLNLTYDFIAIRYPKIKEVMSGDKRVQSKEGLIELFSAKKGFENEIKIDDFSLLIESGHEAAWILLKDMYSVSLLDSSEKDQLSNELRKLLAARSSSQGDLRFEFHMRMFTVTKAASL